MAAITSLTELRKMQPKDLLKEIRSQENEVVKLRLGVKLGKEKDSAKYIRQKKQLARMKTVYNEAPKNTEEPKPEPKKKSSTKKAS